MVKSGESWSWGDELVKGAEGSVGDVAGARVKTRQANSFNFRF